MYIFLNISRGKDNWRMKFGRLIEYNVRSIFLKTSNTKCGAETSLRPLFHKIRIEHVSESTV